MNPFANSRLYGKIGNYLNRPLFRLLPVPPGFALLTTTGRRSGRARRQPVRAVRLDGGVIIASIHGDRSDWYRNLLHNPRLSIKLGSRTLKGTARPPSGAAERREALRSYVQAHTFFDRIDYVALYWAVPIKTRLRRAHEEWARQGLVIIDLERQT